VWRCGLQVHVLVGTGRLKRQHHLSHLLYHCRAGQLSTNATARQREPLPYYLGFDSRAARTEHRPGIEGIGCLSPCSPSSAALLDPTCTYVRYIALHIGRQAGYWGCCARSARHVQAMAVLLMELSCTGRICFVTNGQTERVCTRAQWA
jgi:hypothetical protein